MLLHVLCAHTQPHWEVLPQAPEAQPRRWNPAAVYLCECSSEHGMGRHFFSLGEPWSCSHARRQTEPLAATHAGDCSSNLIFTFTRNSILGFYMLPAVNELMRCPSIQFGVWVLNFVRSVLLFRTIQKFDLWIFSTSVTHLSNLDINFCGNGKREHSNRFVPFTLCFEKCL